MEDITFKISVDKLIDMALAEQKFAIKKYLTSTLGQSGGDLLDKFIMPVDGVIAVIKSLSENKEE